MTLLICPVKPGDQNEELRYALRSWEENLRLDGGIELLVVGDCPSWLQPDYFVKGNTSKAMDRVVMENIMFAAFYAQHELGVEEAVFMNDDFFCLDPVTSVVPVRRNITIGEHAVKNPGSSWWGDSLRVTVELAEAWSEKGGDAHSFEVHRPLLADLEHMTAALDHVIEWMRGRDSAAPQWRTAYGLWLDEDADDYLPVRDVKVSGAQAPRPGSPWLSTDDSSWRFLGPAIRKRFQNPSRWEK